MDILFIGKRFYTNRDAYKERFGRIYQLPYYWSKEVKTQLWLIDYHSKEKINNIDESLEVVATPVFSVKFIFTFIKILFNRPKVIVASGDCYIGLLGFILAKLTFSKFVFDVYDKYDAFTGYKNLGFKNLLDYLVKNSDFNLFASRILANKLNSQKPYHIVPNGVDYSKFKPFDKNQSRKNFNINRNEIVVGYIGSLETERGIDDLILAVKSLENVKLVIAGKNSHDINLNHDFIYYLGNVDFKLVPHVISCCDILAIPYRRSEQINYGTSCKIAEYIAMGKPIAATESANLFEDFPEYVNKFPKNYIATCNDPIHLAEVINKQIDAPILFEKLESMDWSYIGISTLSCINKWLGSFYGKN